MADGNLENAEGEVLDDALYGHLNDPSKPAPGTVPPEKPEVVVPPVPPVVEAQPPNPAAVAPNPPEPPTPPAPPVVEKPEPQFPNLEALPEEKQKLIAILARNPDMKPEDALAQVREGAPQPPEPVVTIDDELADIDRQLEEAVENESLLTPELVKLNNRRSELVAQKAVMAAEEERAQKVEYDRLVGLRNESKARVIDAYGADAQDEKTPLGAMITTVFEEMQAENNPDLYKPDAPELIVAKANARLPEDQRVTPKKKAPATPPPSSQSAPAAPVVPSVTVLPPVSGNERTAQPASFTPAEVSRKIRELNPEELDKVLYPGGPGVDILR